MNIELKLEDSMWTAPEAVIRILPKVRWTEFTHADWREARHLLLAQALAIEFKHVTDFRAAGWLSLASLFI